MPPAAVLRVLVQAAGIAATNRDLMTVHATLGRVSDEADRAIESLHRLGATSVTATATVRSDVGDEVDRASRQLELFGRESATASLDVDSRGVRTEVDRASREVNAFGRERATATLNVNTLGERALAQARAELDKTAIAAYRAEHGMAAAGNGGRDGSAGVDVFRASIGPVSGGLSVMTSAALFLGVALLALIGPAIAVASALAPLVGLGGALAAGALAGAQGLGVLKLATAGVMDALKEQTTAHASAGTAATKQAGQELSAARSIQAAQEGVRSAKDSLTQATQQLSEAQRTERQAIAALPAAYAAARRALTDFKTAATDTQLALRGARLDATDAHAALLALLAGPSPRELANAHLAVSDAMRGEKNAALDLAAATQALNDLLAPPAILDVADAQDAVADSMRGQAHAAQDVIDATQAVADAQAALAGLPAGATDAQHAAAVSTLANAQLRLADAQDAVGDAVRGTQHAQERLAALQAPADALAVAQAQGRVADAQAGVTAAVQGTADAEQALRQLQTVPAEQIARARLADADAQQALTRATIANARAQADLFSAQQAGISGSASVVAAREQLRTATMGVASAEHAVTNADHQLVLALRAVNQAQQAATVSSAGAAAGAVDLNAKLNALPPAARAFVLLLVAMKAKADDLRATAAAGFFPGASEGLTAAARNFEPVEKVVGETATVLGDLARRSGELVGSAGFGRDIQTVGARNAGIIRILGDAALHLVDALRHVIVTAGPLTTWLARVADGWAKNIDNAAAAGRENGKLAGFFEKTRAVLERVGSIVGHVAHGLLGLGTVGAQSGRDILRSINAAAIRFDAWANSDAGREKLKTFFHDSAQLAAALTHVVAGLASGFGTLSLKLLPVAAVLGLLGPHAHDALIAFVAFRIAMVAWNIVAAVSTFVTGGWTAAFWALNAAIAANPIGLAVVAIAALVAGLIYAYHHSETFRQVIDTAFAAVKVAFGWLLTAAQDVFGWLQDHWPLVLEIVAGPLGLVAVLVIKHWDTVKGATIAVWTAVSGFLTGTWNIIKTVASAVWEAIKFEILTPIRFVRDTIPDIVTGIANRLAAGWAVVKAAASAAWDAVRDFVLTPVRAARDAIPDVLTGIATRLDSAWTGIKAAASAAWDAVRDHILGPVRDARDAIGDVVTGIANRVSDGWAKITKGAATFAGDIKDAIVGAIEGAAKAVLGFVNDIIHIINKIPGVPNIGDIKIDGLAKGGTHSAAGIAAGAGSATAAFAHGGAFARTGGIVGQPITLMGEEAPLHPEFVIPTNPAYRDRAMMLLAKAAGAIGLAQGGVYNKGDLMALWDKDGGNPASANIAAAIALAESAGRANATNVNTNGTIDRGLWQINSIHGALSTYDPDGNARAAVNISSNGRNWNPWVTYTTGAYQQFLGAGVGASINAGSSTGIGGILGDILSHGASFILDQLPGVGKLPDWIQGLGHYALDHVGDWIKDKITGLISTSTPTGGGGAGPGPAGGPAGVGTFAGIPMATWVIDALTYGRAHGAHGNPTSGYRPGFDVHTATGRSEHQGTQYPHGAVDFGGFHDAAAYVEKMSYVNATKGFKWPLLAPQGFVDDGHASGTGHYMGGVYASYEDGTDYVPRTGLALLHQGESVTPADGRHEEIELTIRGDGELTELLAKMIDVKITRNGRTLAATWKAGKR